MITSYRFLFKFFFIFFLLLIFPFPFSIIPGCSFLDGIIMAIYSPMITWLGGEILDYEISIARTGSGDMSFYYLLNGFFLVIAFLGAVIWSLFDKKKEAAAKLNDLLLVLLRYYLAYFMLSYGFGKVYLMQFPEPSFSRLLQPYGESSPMGLAWTFLGYSSAYSIFAGMAEVIGGLLLFHRRTAILGSLIIMVVMTNVFVMNMCFDIPVKLFSFQLLFISILIAWSSIKRILDVILFNKPVAPLEFNAYFNSPSWNLSKRLLKWGIVLHLLLMNYSTGVLMYDTTPPKPFLYGLYEITSFIEDEAILPPLITDKKRWKYFIVEVEGGAQIVKMDGTIEYFRMEANDSLGTIKLRTRDSTEIGNLHYQKTNETMLIEGVFRGDVIACESTIRQKSDFVLTGRGFRWINEYPYNK